MAGSRFDMDKRQLSIYVRKCNILNTARSSCELYNNINNIQLLQCETCRHLGVPIGPSVNKEYLFPDPFLSIFSKLLLLSNTVLIITVCVKIANSTFLVTNKRTKWAELSKYYLCNCFVR